MRWACSFSVFYWGIEYPIDSGANLWNKQQRRRGGFHVPSCCVFWFHKLWWPLQNHLCPVYYFILPLQLCHTQTVVLIRLPGARAMPAWTSACPLTVPSNRLVLFVFPFLLCYKYSGHGYFCPSPTCEESGSESWCLPGASKAGVLSSRLRWSYWVNAAQECQRVVWS